MTTKNLLREKLDLTYAPIASLRMPKLNPRKWSEQATRELKESIKRFGMVDPLLA